MEDLEDLAMEDPAMVNLGMEYLVDPVMVNLVMEYLVDPVMVNLGMVNLAFLPKLGFLDKLGMDNLVTQHLVVTLTKPLVLVDLPELIIPLMVVIMVVIMDLLMDLPMDHMGKAMSVPILVV